LLVGKRSPAWLTAALAKANDAPPFLYLLTPNQMIDNDYRLPSYLAPSNASPIPEVARQGLSGELIAMLSHQTLEADGELEVHATSALSTTDAVDEKMNGNTDEGWVETPSAKGPPDDGRWKILALDCEMVSDYSNVADSRSSPRAAKS
jgi:RNA exonuclease 1